MGEDLFHFYYQYNAMYIQNPFLICPLNFSKEIERYKCIFTYQTASMNFDFNATVDTIGCCVKYAQV